MPDTGDDHDGRVDAVAQDVGPAAEPDDQIAQGVRILDRSAELRLLQQGRRRVSDARRGTFTLRKEDDEWETCPPEVPSRLQPGSQA